jgi:hypothetical protein
LVDQPTDEWLEEAVHQYSNGRGQGHGGPIPAEFSAHRFQEIAKAYPHACAQHHDHK